MSAVTFLHFEIPLLQQVQLVMSLEFLYNLEVIISVVDNCNAGGN